ncbi:carbohydrate sulfotransferase 7 isoform X1 [Cricetulus griseus]|uniref:carbohydrate sulfotransferase 7 isoform X1 n=1 Tax=Cricetulus griseus TaxID=10029 RepID=UPI000454464B|nr:carbohydrate sulfotransferase 7 isoform X1 [Cricetulus griseus]
MKGRRRRRREYCKFTLLLVLYTLLLLLVPSVLDSGSEQDKGVRHCPGLQRSLGVWSLEAAAAGDYEDLVWQPQAQLRRLLRFSGLRTLAALDAFAINMTRGSAYGADRPFHLSARDAREAVHAWRERLSQEQVRQVEAACGPAMRLLAYPRSRDDVETAREAETPLETKTNWAT